MDEHVAVEEVYRAVERVARVADELTQRSNVGEKELAVLQAAVTLLEESKKEIEGILLKGTGGIESVLSRLVVAENAIKSLGESVEKKSNKWWQVAIVVLGAAAGAISAIMIALFSGK